MSPKCSKKNKTLSLLALSFNGISDLGVADLANALTHHNNSLKFLNLSFNESVSDVSVNPLVEMLKHNQTLKNLVMDSCNLSGKGKEKLRQFAQSKKGFELSV
jgi:Ran GTPase-activating protein (RanGAP) involved in mRNA processing and transport